MISHAGGTGATLLVDLINAGRIPGITRADVARAAWEQAITGQPGRLRLPVVYCGGCRAQLTAHWYAVNPVTDLMLVCLFCARTAETAGGVVHALVTPC